MQLGRFWHEKCFTLWPPHWRCWISLDVLAPLGQGNSVSSLLFTLSNGRNNSQLWTCCFLATVIGTWIHKQHFQRLPQKCRAVLSPFLSLLGFLLNFVAVLHQRRIMYFTEEFSGNCQHRCRFQSQEENDKDTRCNAFWHRSLLSKDFCPCFLLPRYMINGITYSSCPMVDNTITIPWQPATCHFFLCVLCQLSFPKTFSWVSDFYFQVPPSPGITNFIWNVSTHLGALGTCERKMMFDGS